MKYGTIIAGIAAICALSSAAHAELLTFDDLVDEFPVGECSDNDCYGGLNWTNFYYENGPSLPGTGYANGVISPPNIAFNGMGLRASISRYYSPDAGPFTLVSGYFTGAWNNGLTVSVVGIVGGVPMPTGMVGGVPAYSTSFTVSAESPTLETFNWADLSEVDFTSAGGTNAGFGHSGTQFVLDNLTIGLAVPEPAPWAMMLTGFGLVGFAMRKRASLRVSLTLFRA